MKLLDQHQELRKQILEYFGYEEQWAVYPIDDAREHFWRLESDGSGGGTVWFAESEESVGEGEGYSNEIYTQRHLNKWVYRGKEFTMMVVDTHTDGNKFLQIFDNSKERP